MAKYMGTSFWWNNKATWKSASFSLEYEDANNSFSKNSKYLHQLDSQ